MKDFKKEYYEQSEHWGRDFSKIPAEVERVKEIIRIIPDDIQSILDIGCGNGFFINSLAKEKKQYKRLIGLDPSKEALKYVKTEKILGSIENLPVKDKSFDLVTCLEVLEHLPQENFKKGISELQRVSKRYILITVPNKNDLEHSLVMCPKCYCWFNPYFHMRSFSKEKLKNLFSDFKIVHFREIGSISKKYPLWLLNLYHSFKKPLFPIAAICLQCGYRCKNEGKEKFFRERNEFTVQRTIFSLIKSLARIIWRPKEKTRWLIALYQKRW